ncbi:hypothetical protein HNR06_001455 [Nocardiopsis arvandica]|uniref:Uncharacterized protein n=1 Tax=Nocardiopsis sinuspersici TaxID=501010 RepID=A0A7Y9X9S8_9ACTN|nr:hypothetical protein [Nocardiopsis sinuspersici]NYH51866.1 hypothetical protein [Nocardiopsis sinuspersici]
MGPGYARVIGALRRTGGSGAGGSPDPNGPVETRVPDGSEAAASEEEAHPRNTAG